MLRNFVSSFLPAYKLPASRDVLTSPVWCRKALPFFQRGRGLLQASRERRGGDATLIDPLQPGGKGADTCLPRRVSQRPQSQTFLGRKLLQRCRYPGDAAHQIC